LAPADVAAGRAAVFPGTPFAVAFAGGFFAAAGAFVVAFTAMSVGTPVVMF